MNEKHIAGLVVKTALIITAVVSITVAIVLAYDRFRTRWWYLDASNKEW